HRRGVRRRPRRRSSYAARRGRPRPLSGEGPRPRSRLPARAAPSRSRRDDARRRAAQGQRRAPRADRRPFTRARDGVSGPAEGLLTRPKLGGMPEYIYTLQRVRKAHGDKVVLDDVTLSFLPGAKIGVLGPNGTGKS